MNSKYIIPVVAVMVIGIATYGAANVFADTTSTTPQTSLIQKLVQKFGLKEADVKAVFDENRTEMHAKMIERSDERLTNLVTDGKITEAQKQLILNKEKELQSKHEANRDKLQAMSREERRDAMKTERDDLEAWAKQNNIDIKYVFGFGRGHGMHGMMGKF